MRSSRVLYRVAAVVDALDVNAAPGALLVENGRIVAAGAPEAIGVVPEARLVDRPDLVVIPGLVNAHTHLDLSHIGPMPPRGSFVEWIEMIRERRHTEPDAIGESVERGVELSLAGGTGIVGDIAGIGSSVPIETLRRSPLQGVSFLEVFGAGSRQERAIQRLNRAMEELPHEAGGVSLGLQPHAPYSCGVEVYQWASRSGRPVSTHLLETPEEVQFAQTGEGPLRKMLEDFGVWEEGIGGRAPLEALSTSLQGAPWLMAHVNYPQPGDLDRLGEIGAMVVYCPRASAYFGHPVAGASGHSYREMLERGIQVALGTDSLVCLDTPDRISILDEMRHLSHRDGVEAELLLAMATVHGAVALGLEPGWVSLHASNRSGALGVVVDNSMSEQPLERLLASERGPVWIISPWDRSHVKMGKPAR